MYLFHKTSFPLDLFFSKYNNSYIFKLYVKKNNKNNNNYLTFVYAIL